MKKSKIYFLLFLLTSTFVGCIRKDKNETYEILNSTFTTIVDTIAYDYNTLRPAPNMEKLKQQHSVYPISIYKDFTSISHWDKEVSLILNTQDTTENKDFLILFNKSRPQEMSTTALTLNILNKTGKFKLLSSSDEFGNDIKNKIGHVQFSQILSNGKEAIFVVRLQDNIKSGVERLMLLKKNGTWELVRQYDINIW